MEKVKKNKRSSRFKKYRNNGLTGLANLGNTCFLNSTIQCLSHTYEFNEFLNTKSYESRLNNKDESLILCEWDKLRNMMWSENCVIQPSGFVKAIQQVARIKNRVIFTGYAQNDLTEFLDFCMSCFHDAIKREVEMVISGKAENDTDELAIKCYEMLKKMYSKEYSEVLTMFYGIEVSIINSKESNYKSITPEPFFNIMLPIGKTKTLMGCIDLYTESETLDGDNKLTNDKTNKKEVMQKKVQFWSFPNILVFTLKRFSNIVRKNQEYIDYPLTDFDLSKYVMGYDDKKYVYDLYGICNHTGGVQGGHYYAYVKNANGKWYKFNDTSVSEITNLATLQTPHAYCFFYRKQKCK
tara:strand:- start:662 stop:1720 length:1059 start_codon:yes stop_codon:yes gene_type:complete